MELASMLAGERFSDRPRSACPVLAGFLRAYNDEVDDARRQDLRAYAAQVVDTRARRRVMRARAALCLAFIKRFEAEPPERTGLELTPAARARAIGYRAGMAAARNRAPNAHSMALALLDTLIALTAGRTRKREGADGPGLPGTRSDRRGRPMSAARPSPRSPR